jgi:hypothetical protein
MLNNGSKMTERVPIEIGTRWVIAILNRYSK